VEKLQETSLVGGVSAEEGRQHVFFWELGTRMLTPSLCAPYQLVTKEIVIKITLLQGNFTESKKAVSQRREDDSDRKKRPGLLKPHQAMTSLNGDPKGRNRTSLLLRLSSENSLTRGKCRGGLNLGNRK